VAAVEVRDLRKTYGHVVAVNDLSFTIDHREVFALLGPERSGQAHRRALARIRLPLVVLLHALAHRATGRSAARRG
jgi:ABC-type Na+ transport system ATPase subunit NatA